MGSNADLPADPNTWSSVCDVTQRERVFGDEAVRQVSRKAAHEHLAALLSFRWHDSQAVPGPTRDTGRSGPSSRSWSHLRSTTSTPSRSNIPDGDRTGHREGTTTRRVSTETKASFKTTEFFAYLAAMVGVLIAAGVVDENNAGGFGAKQAWLYVTILTVGYMLSRGFAKSGSREPYTTDDRS